MSLSSKNVTIREFTLNDYDALITLWNEAGLPYKPQGRDRRDKIAHEIRHPNAIFLVAESNGRLIGSVFGTHDGRKGWINRLAVAPDFRRQGLAAALVKTAEARLMDLGIEITACLIEDWNTSSMRFFEKLGYQRHPDIIYFSKRKSPET